MDTCFDANDWSADNPARGQCVVSALIVQDHLGGDLMRYDVTGENLSEKHYCNIVGGTIIDTTGQQYREPVTMRPSETTLKGFASARDKLLADQDTKRRYEILRKHVTALLTD